MLFRLFKFGLLAFVAYLLLVVARPLYWEAWRAKRVAEQVSARSEGRMREEVSSDYLESLNRVGIKQIKKDELVLERDGRKWAVGLQYEASRQIRGGLSFVVNFDFLSGTSGLW